MVASLPVALFLDNVMWLLVELAISVSYALSTQFPTMYCTVSAIDQQCNTALKPKLRELNSKASLDKYINLGIIRQLP